MFRAARVSGSVGLAAVWACLGPVALGASADACAARAARTISLSENGVLHLTSHKGFTLNEQGAASGTISGTIYIHLHVTSTNGVTAEVGIYPRGGSITGAASASYRASGATASFSGTLNILRGSGSYQHAHGSGLAFSGQIKRTNDAVTVHLSGRFNT